MCDPVTILAISTAATMGTQALNMANQKAYQGSMSKAATADANANALQEYSSIQTRQTQEQMSANEAIQRARVQASSAAGSLRVAAGEGGVAGNSVDALHADFERSALNYETSVTRNRAFVDAQLTDQMIAIRAQQRSQILQALPNPVPIPDFIGEAGNAYGKYLQIKQTTKNNSPLG